MFSRRKILSYMLQSTLYLLILVGLAIAQDVTPEAQGFQSTMVVPDVIPVFNPTAVLTVTFTDPATGQQLNVTPAENLTIERKISSNTVTVRD